MTSQTYVINLDGSHERLAAISRQLERAGIAFQRVPAVDGADLDMYSVCQHDPAVERRHLGRTLLPREVGCFLSHVACLRQFVKSGADHALVFEDDAELLEDFTELAGELIELDRRRGLLGHRPWDVVSLCAERHGIFTKLHGLKRGHLLTHAHYFPMRCTVLLWSRAGAEALLRDLGRIDAPFDLYLRTWTLRRNSSLAVWPALARSSGAPSDIEIGGPGTRGRWGRRRAYAALRVRRVVEHKVRAHALKLKAGAG